MVKYWNLIKRELSFIFLKDKKRGALLLFAAVAYLTIFGILYFPGVVNKVPLLIVDESNSVPSRELVKYFREADAFQLAGYGLTEEDAQFYLKDTKNVAAHKAVLMIPHDFGENLAKGRSSNILLMIEGSNIIVTSNSAIDGLKALRYFNRWQSSRTLERDRSQTAWQAPKRVEPVRFNYRILNNPNLDYMFFFIVGLGLAAMQNGVLLSVASGLLCPAQGLSEEEKSIPIYLWWLLKSGVYIVLGLVSYGIFYLTAKFGFGIPCMAPAWQSFFLVAGFIICLTNLTGVLAPILKDELLFTRLSIFYTVPAFMLSGYTWPLEGMPGWVQDLAACSPFTYCACTVRELMLAGYSPHFWHDAVILYVAGGVFCCWAIWMQRRIRV